MASHSPHAMQMPPCCTACISRDYNERMIAAKEEYTNETNKLQREFASHDNTAMREGDYITLSNLYMRLQECNQARFLTEIAHQRQGLKMRMSAVEERIALKRRHCDVIKRILGRNAALMVAVTQLGGGKGPLTRSRARRRGGA